MKYKFTIEELSEVAENSKVYEHPLTKEQITSIYSVKDEEKNDWKLVNRLTGNMIRKSQEIFFQEQEMDNQGLKDVIKAINGILQ